MSLTCKVKIVLNNLSEEKIDAVKRAIEPDNVNFPDGLSLSVEKIDNKLVFSFEDMKEVKRLIGTIDEVLGHVQVALKVIE